MRKILIAIPVIVLFFTVISSVAFAYDVMVSASVKPHYSLQRQANTLLLNTNMTVYLNGNRIFH